MTEVAFTYLASQVSLLRFCEQLEALDAEDLIGLDTEFIREVSYYPRLCLLQLWVRGESYLIDPVSVDLNPFLQSLRRTKALLLVYSGSEDFEVLIRQYRMSGLDDRLNLRCLDLQVLISMLNLGYRVGLAKAVHTFLGIELSKSETRSDWAERPLTAAQLEYAALDVVYLGELFLKLKALSSPQQLSYACSETAETMQESGVILEPAEAYLYVDGCASLSPEALTRLQYLAQRRLEYARVQDEAVNRVITTSALPKIAATLPSTFKSLAGCGMKWGAVREHGEVVLRWIREASKLKVQDSLKAPLSYFLNAREHHDSLRRLKFQLQQQAQAAGICPELLTQKRLLADYLFCRQYGLTPRLNQGWRSGFATEQDQD